LRTQLLISSSLSLSLSHPSWLLVGRIFVILRLW
jgi:hypothetical protein